MMSAHTLFGYGMRFPIRIKLTLLVALPVLLLGVATPILSSVQHQELNDSADDQVEEAERAFWAEMQDDLADLHLASRIIAASEKTRRALQDRVPDEALQVARIFAALYPRLDITLALTDGTVLGDVGPTQTPKNLREIAELRALDIGTETHLFLQHGCASGVSQAPPAQAALAPIDQVGWVLVCEPLDSGYLENMSAKLQLELAFLDQRGTVLSATQHFPTHIVSNAKAGTSIIDKAGRSWATQRFHPSGDVIDLGLPLEVIATVDVTKTTRSVHKRLCWMLSVLGGVGLLTMFIGARVASRMSKNLIRVVAAFERLAHNEYVHVTPFKTHDEIETLVSGYNQMVDGLQERDQLRTTFGKYMTESVLAHLLNGKVTLGGETIKVTILFSDIRSFTTISETMDAQTLVGLLNEYFTEMVGIIMKHGGVVDKYIGDAIMAVFGAPVPTANDAVNAVQAALDMRHALARLNDRLAARGAQPLRTGIGIHTGEVVAGNIGSEQRMEYTVIGDPVNVASRLESCTKELGVNVLISDSTYQEVHTSIAARPVERLSVKGRVEPVMTYEVLES